MCSLAAGAVIPIPTLPPAFASKTSSFIIPPILIGLPATPSREATTVLPTVVLDNFAIEIYCLE
jgi:hypothetical protein